MTLEDVQQVRHFGSVRTDHVHQAYTSNLHSNAVHGDALLTEPRAGDGILLEKAAADAHYESDTKYAASIFSQSSIASSATSLEGDSMLDSRLHLISGITTEVFFSTDLHSISVGAIKDPEIGAEKLRRNIRRMIKTFGNELRFEATGDLERSTAAAMQTRRISAHAAHEIMTRMGASQHKQQYTIESFNFADVGEQSEASVGSASEDDEVGEPEPDDVLARTKCFLLGSKAYGSFKEHLFEFAHKPRQRRLLVAIGDMAIGACGTRLSSEVIRLSPTRFRGQIGRAHV